MTDARRQLVLASGSPARRRLLENAGFAFEVVVSGIDEDDTESVEPRAIAHELAIRKARAVAARDGARGAVVVGCDTVVDVDGTIHGKPADVAEARARLLALRGRSVLLFTGHCVVDSSARREVSAVESTVVRFGHYSELELDAYLATGEPLGVAGAFTLLGRSAPFLAGIDGDPGNVIGISLPLLRSLLTELDLALTDFWT